MPSALEPIKQLLPAVHGASQACGGCLKRKKKKTEYLVVVFSACDNGASSKHTLPTLPKIIVLRPYVRTVPCEYDFGEEAPSATVYTIKTPQYKTPRDFVKSVLHLARRAHEGDRAGRCSCAVCVCLRCYLLPASNNSH